MARPTPRAFWVLCAAVLPAAFAVSVPRLGWAVVMIDALVLALFLVDLWLARQGAASVLRRELPERVLRNRPFEVGLSVENGSERPLRVWVADCLPVGFEPRATSADLVVPPLGTATSTLSVVARRRGEWPLDPPAGERFGPLGLSRRSLQVAPAGQVTVLPDLAPVRGFEALLRQRRLAEMGIRNARERGEGTEVVGLRPYVSGDPYGSIDWKASARSGRTISRERQAERRQNVVLLMDTGRRMVREADGRSRLDTAIEAAILLGQVALRSDDRVGLLAFADTTLRTLAPLRVATQATKLVRALAPLEAVPREPPYRAIAADVMLRFPKRSLLVLFTDVAEPRSIDALIAPARVLSRRHLLLFVIFADPAIDAALRHPPAAVRDLYRAGAAAELAMERERGLRALRRGGVLVLEAGAAQLPTAVVNEYLRIKARRLL